MDTLATVLVLVGILAAIVFVGFLIVFIVGLSIKKGAPKTVGKLGMIISAVFILIGFGGGQLAIDKINEQQAKAEAIKAAEVKKEKAEKKKANKKFNKAEGLFRANVYLAVSDSEDLAKVIYKGWGDAIDNSSDNFDVDTTIQKLVSDNQTDIDTMESAVASAKESLTTMENNDTGDYDLNFYEKMYKHTRKLTDFVASPSGSYSEFIDTFNGYHQKVDDDIDELTN